MYWLSIRNDWLENIMFTRQCGKQWQKNKLERLQILRGKMYLQWPRVGSQAPRIWWPWTGRWRAPSPGSSSSRGSLSDSDCVVTTRSHDFDVLCTPAIQCAQLYILCSFFRMNKIWLDSRIPHRWLPKMFPHPWILIFNTHIVSFCAFNYIVLAALHDGIYFSYIPVVWWNIKGIKTNKNHYIAQRNTTHVSA